MLDFVEKLGLTTPEVAKGAGALEWLGYIVHGTRETAASSNVADVFNSILNMAGFATTIVVIMLSAGFSARFGKKAVIFTGFALGAQPGSDGAGAHPHEPEVAEGRSQLLAREPMQLPCLQRCHGQP